MSKLSSYRAITGDSNSIYLGGYTADDNLSEFPGNSAVVTKIDLEASTTIWMMNYGV